ncbi:type IV conjugative transfer system pilin TraA [Photobacterium damselae]|uniref:type IV conjugative transfer system pilin TraA n=1 Tax=Photobacterium damselae TaxID=38293 RepID=UPI004067DAFA
MSTLTLSHSFSMTPTQKKIAFFAVLALTAVVLMLIPHSAWAVGTDMFSAGKDQIKGSAGKDSTLWFAMTVVGLAVAAVTGFITKNWFAAIGGFFAGMIFLNVAAGIIGLN